MGHHDIVEAPVVVLEVDKVAGHRHKTYPQTTIIRRTRRVHLPRNRGEQASERTRHRRTQHGITESLLEKMEGREIVQPLSHLQSTVQMPTNPTRI